MESQHQTHPAAWQADVIDLATCGVAATSIMITTAWFAATSMFAGAFF